jgi:hypothetical protein
VAGKKIRERRVGMNLTVERTQTGGMGSSWSSRCAGVAAPESCMPHAGRQ